MALSLQGPGGGGAAVREMLLRRLAWAMQEPHLRPDPAGCLPEHVTWMWEKVLGLSFLISGMGARTASTTHG